VSAAFASKPDQYALTPWDSSVQYWRPGYEVGKSDAEVAGAVMHELLHNMGFSDHDIQMGLFGLGGVSDITDNITQKLKTDCFGGH